MSYGGLTYVNPNLVNYDNSQWSASFTSKQIPSHGLPEPLNKVEASSGNFTGGGKRKNNYLIYKTMGGTRRTRQTRRKKYNNNKKFKYLLDSILLTKKRLSKKKYHKKSKGRKTQHRHYYYKKMKGGWNQYQNNVPVTPTYSVGALQSTNSNLANPPPYNVLSNCTNCVDNYNHFLRNGFPSPSN
jgi:hypothetical protein